MSYRDDWKLEDYEREVQREERYVRSEELELEVLKAKAAVAQARAEKQESYIEECREDLRDAVARLQQFKNSVIADTNRENG